MSRGRARSFAPEFSLQVRNVELRSVGSVISHTEISNHPYCWHTPPMHVARAGPHHPRFPPSTQGGGCAATEFLPVPASRATRPVWPCCFLRTAPCQRRPVRDHFRYPRYPALRTLSEHERRGTMALGRANALADDLVSFAMEEGFQRSLVELAKAHENKTGRWLQTIESEVMATLKGSLATSGAQNQTTSQLLPPSCRWRPSSGNSGTASRKSNSSIRLIEASRSFRPEIPP